MEELEVEEPARKYTYKDYLNSDDDIRYELIDGVIYMMSSPSQAHQDISGELYGRLWNFLRGKPCKVYHAPFDVLLNADTTDDTVLQPDLLVVCDMAKLDGKSCVGAPDMVIEILSPSTSKKDRIIKLNRYLQAGVREFWIVDPDDKGVTVYILKNGEYIVRAYEDTDIAPVHVLDGCRINLPEVFAVL